MSSIMVINAKGGSGKTTISTNLASYFASNGYKVTLVDLDPQGSSTKWLSSRPITKAKIKGIVVLLELSFLGGRSKIKNKLISLNKVNT